TSVGPVPVGAGQQIVDKIAAQIEFDLSDGSLVGKLQRQNDAAIAQGKQVVLSYRAVRVVHREDTEDLGPGLDKCEYSPSDSCLTGLCGQLVQQGFAFVRRLFRGGAGLSGSGPAAEVAEPIFESRRMPCQVI